MNEQLHPHEPTTFEGEKPDGGYEWLNAAMNAVAAMTGEMYFLMFALGQTGALYRTAPAELPEFIERLEIDLKDFKDAATQFVATFEGIIANSKRNLEELDK